MNSRKCEVCNVDVHRASYVEHLRSKKHLKFIKQNEMTIPEWLFNEPIENQTKKLYNPKPLTQLARDKIELDDKQLNKELAKKMVNPYYFTNKNLKVGFTITLESHHINHANSELTITPNYPEFQIEVRYFFKIMKELSIIYNRLINHYKFKYQTVFSTRFDKQVENFPVLDETDLFINKNINHNLTENDLDKIDVKSPLEHQSRQQEMKDSGWRLDNIKFLTV